MVIIDAMALQALVNHCLMLRLAERAASVATSTSDKPDTRPTPHCVEARCLPIPKEVAPKVRGDTIVSQTQIQTPVDEHNKPNRIVNIRMSSLYSSGAARPGMHPGYIHGSGGHLPSA